MVGTSMFQEFHIFSPNAMFNHLILFLLVFMLLDPIIFPKQLCAQFNICTYCIYVISRLDFIFPWRHTNKLKFSLKTITGDRRKQRHPCMLLCRVCSVTEFGKHRKSSSYLPIVVMYDYLLRSFDRCAESLILA